MPYKETCSLCKGNGYITIVVEGKDEIAGDGGEEHRNGQCTSRRTFCGKRPTGTTYCCDEAGNEGIEFAVLKDDSTP